VQAEMSASECDAQESDARSLSGSTSDAQDDAQSRLTTSDAQDDAQRLESVTSKSFSSTSSQGKGNQGQLRGSANSKPCTANCSQSKGDHGQRGALVKSPSSVASTASTSISTMASSAPRFTMDQVKRAAFHRCDSLVDQLWRDERGRCNVVFAEISGRKPRARTGEVLVKFGTEWRPFTISVADGSAVFKSLRTQNSAIVDFFAEEVYIEASLEDEAAVRFTPHEPHHPHPELHHCADECPTCCCGYEVRVSPPGSPPNQRNAWVWLLEEHRAYGSAMAEFYVLERQQHGALKHCWKRQSIALKNKDWQLWPMTAGDYVHI